MKISELKGKHDHALTSWLKVIVFSLLMIAPLFASISQWVYVSFNKNAKDSYAKAETTEIQYINTDSIIFGKQYRFIPAQYTTTDVVQIFYEEIAVYGNPEATQYIEGCDRIYLRPDGTIVFYKNGAWETEYLYNAQAYAIDMVIKGYLPNVSASETTLKSLLNVESKNESAYLDNAFYYGVEKMTQSDLFNWTQNTTLYTGIKTMTDNLEIQTPAIAILLTYWFILTIIYVIIDIVLKGFTTLTHLIAGGK